MTDDFAVPDTDEELERFRIYDLASATWTMKKLREVERQRAEIRQLAADEREQITLWEQDALRSTDHRQRVLTNLLEDFARRERADGRLSVSTPWGRVQTTAAQPKWVFDNGFIEWAKSHGRSDLVRIKEEIDKVEAKKAFEVTEHGEVIDPITAEIVPAVVEPQPPTVVVKVSL